MTNQSISNKNFALIAVLSTLVGTFSIAQAADDNWPPKVTSDGLNLVEGTKAAAVWLKDGADFSEYHSVMIVDVGVSFVKNWRRDYNRDEIALGSKVSKSDAEKIKQRVADEFKTVFKQQLNSAGYLVFDYDVKLANEDVLVLRPAIVDLIVTAPDVQSASSSHTFTASAGGMTLYMEFYDSLTSSILGRVVDRQNARDNGMMQISNRVTNKSAADRLFRKWADLLIVKMDAVMKK